MTTETQQLQARNFNTPDESFPVAGVARVEVIRLDAITANRVTFQPGFRWAEHVKPSVGTDLCLVPHTGYVISGRVGIRMTDGTERELTAGDVFDVPPGHDVWVIGDEPYIAVDFTASDSVKTPLKR